jgi:hypothetical protein
MQTCSVSDAPRYRLWPPIDVGVPLVLGLTLTATLGDPVSLPHWLGPFGWLLVGAFALWNGWLAARRGIRAVERVCAGAHGQESHRGAPWRADTDCIGPQAVPRIPQPALPRAAGATRRDSAAVAVVLGARRGSRLGWIAPLGRYPPRGAPGIPET